MKERKKGGKGEREGEEKKHSHSLTSIESKMLSSVGEDTDKQASHSICD